MSMERLSGDYIRGYTRAILDVIEIFEYIQDDLKVHGKRMNGKLTLQLLKVILNEREKIRESNMNADGGFVRFNGKLNNFEYFKKGGR